MINPRGAFVVLCVTLSWFAGWWLGGKHAGPTDKQIARATIADAVLDIERILVR